MLPGDWLQIKPMAGQGHELLDKAINAIRSTPFNRDLQKKIEAWGELSRTAGPVYPVYGIVDGRCTCGDPKCSKPGKHPWTARGYKDATRDEAQIEEWVTRKPHANVGIATGGEICVIDIDGPNGESELRKLEQRHGDLPTTWEVQTGREGGRHLYFTKPPDVHIKSRTIAHGLDIKAEGGGVVGPGSRHSSGKFYTVLDETRDMAELPESWLEFLLDGSNRETKSNSTSTQGKIKEGDRNNTIYRVALNIWKVAGEKSVVHAAAHALNQSKCEPPLPADEVDHVVASACKKHNSSLLLPQTPVTVTASEVLGMDLPPTKWLVNRVIPPGVGLLVGKPKAGKSWLALNLAVAVALGKPLFNSFPVAQGSVLYLALEDNHFRLQERLRDMGLSVNEPLLRKIHFAIWWPTFDETHHGLEYVEKHIDDIGDCVLVIIDLLENVRPGKKGNKSEYEVAYQDLNPIKQLAQHKNINVLVLHHTNKAVSENPLDSVLGSTGLTAATDYTMILQRDDGGSSPNGTLIVRGRDLKEDVRARVTLADGWWKWLGSVDQMRRNDNDNKVLAVLTSEPRSFTSICKESGIAKSTCSGVLERLAKDGVVIRDSNKMYRLAPEQDPAEEQDEIPF
jgi:hypothetical protein